MDAYLNTNPPYIDIESNSLLNEFKTWSSENAFPIQLLKIYVSEDGRTCLDFVMKQNETFSILCPPNQSDDDESNFFVVSCPLLQFWCNALNEFILDSTEKITLTSILSKGVSMYQLKANIAALDLSDTESDSDDIADDENNENAVDDMEEDFMDSCDFGSDWRVICEKKKRWRAKEAQLRATTNQPKTSDMFSGKVKDHPTQIFSNSAASGVLTNDLLNIMKEKHETGISAEPIDDNIYRWSVLLSKFTPGTDIYADLTQLQEKFNYDYVEIELNFTMDLYPFYPPTLKVIRPRLSGNVMLVIASMDLLKLSYWNPTKPMNLVLQEIKNFIQKWGRLDLNCTRNDISLYPDGAYLDIENYLLHLTSVSEIQTRAHARYPHAEEGPALFASLGESAKMTQTGQKLPRGTGYSSHVHTGWNIDSFLAAQKEKDKQLEVVLQSILTELKKFHSCSEPSFPNKVATSRKNVDTYSSFSVPESMSTAMEVDTSTTDPEFEELQYLYCVLEASSLISFLENRLQADSFLEICKHTAVYQFIVAIIEELALIEALVPLLWDLPDQTQSVYTLVKKLESKAATMLNQLEKVSANGSVSTCEAKTDDSSHDNTASEEKLARGVCNMAQAVTAAVTRAGFLTVGEEQTQMAVCETNSSASVEQLPEAYVKALKGLQFLDCEIDVDGANAHHFASAFKGDPSPNSKQVMRLTQDLDALSTSLPIDIGSAIFVRTDDSKITLFRALIIGPEDTPYSGGCFLFDIYCPPKYPTVPPSVHFCTTGMGKVRFNPNLYPCGTVCLSLLGTWKGLQGEQWHKDTSTLLQVLISIQSLIFVPEPYFNEPGFEALFGSEKAKGRSLEYNEDIMAHTILHAMIYQIQYPSPGFKDVIHTHFRLKKHRILQEIQNCLKLRYSKKIEQQYTSLKNVLDKYFPDVKTKGAGTSKKS